MLDIIQENWQIIKENVRDEYDIINVSYTTWIEPLKIYTLEDNTLKVIFPAESVDSNFAIGYITKRFALPFQVTIEELLNLHVNVEFITEPKEKSTLFNSINENINENSIFEKANLNPRYTFDTFVVGANNRFAHAASLSVAESPGQDYNPLFIYGGPGLGKTHLMHSIAHFILKNNPNANCIYVSSEVFTNELIDAFRNKDGVTLNNFKNKYRNVDVLLIDDIQFIIGKQSTEEEFFNTFNYLYENRKQIVLSSDKPPRDFTTLEERLRTRFTQGLAVDISSPDYETRMAILRKKEETEGYSIDNEILHYIATNIKSNIRELEGALTKMVAYSKLHSNTNLTLEIAKENLKDQINPENENKLNPERIIKVVAEHFGLKPEEIKSQKRTKEVVLPRQICMYLIRIFLDISLEDVGKILGKRDHSTVIHGYEKIIDNMNNDKSLVDTINIIKKKLEQ